MKQDGSSVSWSSRPSMTRAVSVIVLGLILAVPLKAQEGFPGVPRKNNLSVNPMVWLDRTVSVTYSRYMNQNWNLTLTPRVRFARDEHTTIEPSWLNVDKLHEPFIYSRVFLRGGMQFHEKWYQLESLFQLDYGWLRDRSLVVYDSEEGSDHDISETQDRDYFSVGILMLAGTYHDFGALRIQTYIGAGSHIKYFLVDAKDVWPPDPEWTPYTDGYFKLMLSLHLGLEIGISF